MNEAVLRAAEEEGWQAAVVPSECSRIAHEKLLSLCKQGKSDEAIYREFLAPVEREATRGSPEPRSLIVVAVPDQPMQIRFTLNGSTLTAVISPTYVRGARKSLTAEEQMRQVLAPAGFNIARIRGLKKTALALSGQACYGRNSLAYVPGMGSYHQPVMLASNLPCEEPMASEVAALPRGRMNGRVGGVRSR